MATGMKADGKITIGTSVDVGGLNTGLYKIEKSLKHLSLLAVGAFGIGQLVKFGTSALEAASDLQEVQNVVDVSFTKLDEAGNVISDMTYKIEDFTKSCIDMYGMSELAAKETAGSYMQMGKSMGLTMEEASDMAVSLTALTGDMASFYNISQDYARVALSAVYTGETETLKRYGVILTEANLQEYATARGIQTTVKNMGARDKAILRYQYIMESMADTQGDFERTSGSWANQVKLLQQQWTQLLIVLGDGLISVLTPVLQMLNKLIAATQYYAKVLWSILANIFGMKLQSIAEQTGGAASATEDLSDATDELGSSADSSSKKLNKLLGHYDELNVITKDTKSGSGSGAAGAGLDLGDIDLSQYEKDTGALQDVMSDIDNFYDWGRSINKKLVDMLKGINWDSIYEGAKNFGTNLAQFLNGLISPELFALVGKTIASSLNAAILAVFSFGSTFDWENLGLSIAAFINEFFATFNFEQLANTIDVWVQGIYTTIKTAIKNINWFGEDGVLAGIWDFFSNIDMKTWLIILGWVSLKKTLKFIFSKKFVSLVLQALKNGISTIATKIGLPAFWTKLVTGFKTGLNSAWTAISTAIKTFFAGIWTNLTLDMTAADVTIGAEAFGGIAGYIATGLIGAIIAAIGGFEGGKWLGKALFPEDKSFYENFTWFKSGGFFDTLTSDWESSVKGLTDMAQDGWFDLFNPSLATSLNAMSDSFVNSADSIDEFRDEAGKLDVLKLLDGIKNNSIVEKIKGLLGKAWTAIVDFFKGIGTKIKEFFSGIGEFFVMIGEKISGFFSGLWTNIKTFFQPLTDFFTGISERINEVIEGFGIIFAALQQKVLEFVTPIVGQFVEVWTAVKDTVSNAITAIQDKFNEIISIVTTVVSLIREQFEVFVNGIKEKFEAIKELIFGIFENIKEKFNDIKNVLLDKVHSLIEGIIAKVEPIINTVVNIIDTIKAKFNAFKELLFNGFLDAITWIKEHVIDTFVNAFSTAVETVKGFFTGLWDGIKNGVVSAINGAIDLVQGGINHIIDAINAVIGGFNDMVNWGADSLGLDWDGVGLFEHVTLPHLANGAVIPANHEFAAILGDQKHGTNIEAPLDTIKQALAEVVAELGGIGGNNQNIVLQLNGKQIAQVVWDENNKRYKQTGR